MAKPAEMTAERALHAVDMIRQALDSKRRGELSSGAFEVLVNTYVWPVDPDTMDLSWAKAEAERLGLIKRSE